MASDRGYDLLLCTNLPDCRMAVLVLVRSRRSSMTSSGSSSPQSWSRSGSLASNVSGLKVGAAST